MTDDVAVELPAANSGWLHRRLTYLAFGLGLSALGVAASYGVGRIMGLSSDTGWFRGLCFLLTLAGAAATCAAALWNLVVYLMRRIGHTKKAPRPLLIASCAIFLAGPIAVLAADYPGTPATRPADAQTWAGYGTSRDGISSVTASWVQPSVRALGSRANEASFWVGLRDAEGHLEQVGISARCQRHTPATYYAWYELFPAATVEAGLAVKPGDLLTATVERMGDDHFRLSLLNHTSGRKFSTVQLVRVGNTHAAIVIEESNYGDTDLADFAPVRFTRCAFEGHPIDAFPLTTFDVQGDDGSMESFISPVRDEGTSFTVTRQ